VEYNTPEWIGEAVNFRGQKKTTKSIRVIVKKNGYVKNIYPIL
jgi:hypothetical protein